MEGKMDIKRGGKSSERQILHEMRGLISVLKATQTKKPTKWYERFHERVTFFVKYIGIPGVIIAAIGPVQKLGQEWIEHHNKKYIQTTYIDYATELLKQGSIDRANKLLVTLENQKDFDSRLQYYKAKILIAMAIQQARNYTEAYDTAKILVSIQESKDFFFPSVGGVDDLIELKMALVDIDTAQQRYPEARSSLSAMERDIALSASRLLRANIEYRYGVLDVLQFNLPSAEKHLMVARENARTTNLNLLAANAAFQLAKARQFAGNHASALALYESAKEEFSQLGDQFGLLRTYNNIAMIYFDKEEDEKARKYYNLEQVLARQLGDELGFARAIMNIALIEKRQGNYDTSIRMAMEALGAFKQQNSLIGIHGIAILLSNDYFHLGNFPEALAYAKQAFSSAMQQRDLRAVTAACGCMANVYERLRDNQEVLFTSLCTIALIKYLDYRKLPKSEFDYQYFKATIAGVRAATTAEKFEELLTSSERRVGDIVLELNLEKDILSAEVADLRKS
jgi:tetratricopeptide (TPR) repeat protein